jgi:hypothetical protein
MINQVNIRKVIPSSSWYSGSGDTTINLFAEEITVNSKKSLIKVSQGQSPNTQDANQNDKGKSYILDLKRIEDTIKVRGWIPDLDGETAWNQAWKLRSMCVSGNIDGDRGALTELKIDDVLFNEDTQKAYLEAVTFSFRPTPKYYMKESEGEYVARIEVNLDFYIGDAK